MVVVGLGSSLMMVALDSGHIIDVIGLGSPLMMVVLGSPLMMVVGLVSGHIMVVVV